MVLILLEALLALLLLVLIVWWTMFAGRRNGELSDTPVPDAPPDRMALPAAPSEAPPATLPAAGPTDRGASSTGPR